MSIVLDRLTKRIASQLLVDSVALEVGAGELFVLLGPSGSGKSSILRLIAGLSAPTSGRIFLEGRDVTFERPQDRGAGFVFQSYALFRGMTAGENIEFPMRIRGVSASARARRREEFLELVGLGGFGSRRREELSGGQLQRVALARALAAEPNVLLLDEPFAALDARIRGQLRRSLRDLQRRLGITTILVTHDQEEAFELGDRIGVMHRGRLLEIGSPPEIYARPRTLFGATFLGAGNVLIGRYEKGHVRFGDALLPVPAGGGHQEGDPVQVLVRPDEVRFGSDEAGVLLGRAESVEEQFAGPFRRLRARLPLPAATRQVAPVPADESSLVVDAVVPRGDPPIAPASSVTIAGWHLLDPPPAAILVCDHGRGGTSHLAAARELSERLAALATVLAVAPDAASGEETLARVRRRLAREGLARAEVRIRYGEVAAQIAAETAESIYEVVVLGDRVPLLRRLGLHSRPKRLGARIRAVVRESLAPLLVVDGPRIGFHRLLLCTAAGAPSASDLRIAGRLARRLGSIVTLLHVRTSSNGAETPPAQRLADAARELASLGVEGRIRIRTSLDVATGIAEEATAGAHDVVVVGRRPEGIPGGEPGGNDELLVRILEVADRPVLVVPAGKV